MVDPRQKAEAKGFHDGVADIHTPPLHYSSDERRAWHNGHVQGANLDRLAKGDLEILFQELPDRLTLEEWTWLAPYMERCYVC